MGIKGYKIIGIITFSIFFIMILTALSISNNLTALTTYLVARKINSGTQFG
jgi:hypothetical protein